MAKSSFDSKVTTALSHGAATIIAAFATGRGAAFGVDLWTKASVELDDSGRIKAEITGHPSESTVLLECCVRRVLKEFGMVEKGAVVKTESNILIACGLKSSSTAANAAVLAAVGAVAKERGEIKEVRLDKKTREQRIMIDGQEVDSLRMIKIGVEAALEAKVTITGAFDDASASFLGGYAVTDNMRREILRSGEMEDDLHVLIFVSGPKSYSSNVDVKKVKVLEREIDLAWNEALKGNLYTALTLNGLMHSTIFNFNPNIALEALKAGSVAAGLSGKGPAVVALTRDPAKVKDVWSGHFEGMIIEARVNNDKAKIID